MSFGFRPSRVSRPMVSSSASGSIPSPSSATPSILAPYRRMMFSVPEYVNSSVSSVSPGSVRSCVNSPMAWPEPDVSTIWSGSTFIPCRLYSFSAISSRSAGRPCACG